MSNSETAKYFGGIISIMGNRVNEDSLFLRRLQTSGKYKQAFICLASPIVRKLKLSSHETLIERVEGDKIILSRANIGQESEDGVFH
jgi:hypothetical protein